MLNKENQILIRMNGGHIVVRSKLAALFPKQLWKAHGVLQFPFFRIIVLKDPNGVGPKPATRGGEWEPIKISSEIGPSAYIPKSP